MGVEDSARWPPSVEFIDSCRYRREDALLEYKRQWYDLDVKRGTGEFVKDALALANTVTDGSEAFLLIGMDETKTGAEVVGVQKSPTAEQLAQIFHSYTSPPPSFALAQVQHPKGTVSVVGVFWSQSHPHYATRQIDNVVDPHHVYHRIGPTVAVMMPYQLEEHIRRKDARLGPLQPTDPIQFGFTEIKASNTHPMGAVVIRNVSDEPVVVVRSFFDVTFVRDRTLSKREAQLGEGKFGPGETREYTFSASDFAVYDGTKNHEVSSGENSAFDLTYTVQFRDRSGLIQERSVSLKVKG